MNYRKLSFSGLDKALHCNPPDVTHYQKALEERNRRYRLWMLIATAATVIVEVFRIIRGS